MESTSLVAISGSRLPEMLGNFHLDNHHVEEWSDPSAPGLKHRARKEVGKWVNVEKNADIQYQKQEDSQQSDRSQERSRTEVIQGKAPDSSFQVVRSHRQYQDGDENSGSKMQESSCTSYHVSSSRGVRSTTKTTSNKSTTKTVTVSGGRADDFENLRMSFTPLDTSTQRERISVSRSGTMGIRRPPTRRHTPAALICSSPEDGPEIDRPEDGQILVDSDDNLRDTPDPGKMSEQSGISIVGFKNISPKIRVGFPVEIQLELQTKLRSSSTLEKDHQEVDVDEVVNFEHSKETDKSRGGRAIESSVPAIPLGGLSSANSRDSSFDFRERRKSFLSENFETSSKENVHGSLFGNVNLRRSSLHQYGSSRTRDSDDDHQQTNNHRNSIASFLNQSHAERPTEMSWDLIQNVQMRPRAEHMNISKMYSTLSSDTSSGEEYGQSRYRFNEGEVTDPESESRSRYEESQKESFTQRLKTINTTNGNKKTVVTLNASQESLNYDKKNLGYEQDDSSLENINQESARMSAEDEEPSDYPYHHHHHHHHHHDTNVVSTPDVLHHENSSSTSLSPSLERSRKLLKMLDETPDLLNKMSFRSYFSSTDKQEVKDWEEEKDEMDWETQRQLSFLNDSLSRILDETRSIDSIGVDKDMAAIMSRAAAQNQGSNGLESNSVANALWKKLSQEAELDYNGNFKEMQLGKMSQVSQTWISSVDHKPSQTVRDNDVVTSISATNDTYKKGPKKVEFCKTEVHFTPDSGRFNIVETDENKPSTAHLFRRKKRSEKKSSSSSSSTSQQVAAAPPPVSPYSSSSSMSSLDSTTDKNETAYILEMQVENDTVQKTSTEKKDGEMNILFSTSQTESRSSKQNQNKEDNRSKVNIGVPDSFQSQWEKSVKKVHGLMEVTASKRKSTEDLRGSSHDINSLPVLTSSNSSKSGSEKSSEKSSSNRVLINLENIDNEDYDDDIRSPSHTILSNYGEMKIQRYLKQLKLPSSREGSSSPVGSPTSHETDEDGHFRFDNILYENGSFVPLATRRSLIEMNNRNRKRLNAAASQSSDNSSTTSTYSLPNSDKDNYSTLRLGSVEALVSTGGTQPQITSVEFRYTNDRPPVNPEPDEKPAPPHDLDYHSLSVKERRERFSSVPSPVMPHDHANLNMRSSGRHPIAMSPTESYASESRPSSSAFISKKPPTPILPVQFTTFERTGAELRERFYSKNNTNMCVSSSNEMNESSTTSTRHNRVSEEGKLASKSIVTISGDEGNEKATEEMIVTTTAMDDEDNEALSPEPVLSLDHTWKGPAHYENQQDESQKKPPGSRSLTYPKSPRTEPEWVSKAKSRESRVTDWSLIEKQQQTTLSRNTEPPWISEIRFRNKPIPTEELKSLPKVSVVYPWQRDNSSKESSVERTDLPEQESHIVSIVPEPPMMASTLQREEKRSSSYDLYSGKSLPAIKSLKSVPEVSVAGRKNKSIVEVTSEPENYIAGPQKYQLQTKKEAVATTRAETMSKIEKKSTSMRIMTERANAIEEENKREVREVETMPKKSRKQQVHSTQTTKEVVREGHRSMEKSKTHTQPRPPKPPQRVTSVGREREIKPRETTLMTVPPFRDTSRQQRDRAGGSSSTNYGSTMRKSRSRKSDIDDSPLSSGANTPIHHRHPTIQISKLPMKTSKVSVTEGKRLSGSGSKSKTKHLGQYKIGNKLSVSCRLF
ncbi:unnamed protein product [Orchesella dallaii]|uniref:Uncharacterized protein n=1 Tax=Orchesella dallaii TaxID=48710 RepID=A0ABP1R3J3_9HEXA